MEKSMCMVCCKSPLGKGTGREGGGRRSSSHSSLLTEFCQQLQVTLGENGKNLENILEQGFNNSWTVCGDCAQFIQRTVDKRNQCKEVEDRVDYLQREILKELKRLREMMTQFYAELNEIEDVVRKSDETYSDLMRTYAPSFCVEFLREGILKAVDHLQEYRSGLSVRLMDSDMEQWTIDSTNTSDTIPGMVSIKHEMIDGTQIKPELNEDSNLEWNLSDGNDRNSTLSSSSDESEVGFHSSPLKESPKKRRSDDEAPNVFKNSKCIDYSKLPFLKKYFVRRALNGKKKTPKAEKTDKEEEQKVEVKKYFLEYDHTTKKVNLGGVELILNETAKLVQCGACNFQAKWLGSKAKMNPHQIHKSLLKLELEINEHIHGHHLDAFRCLTCELSYLTKKQFWKHVSRFHRPVNCDICGKQIRCVESLPYHKWTHMSEEEQTEALSKGMKDPRLKSSDRKDKQANLKLFCGVCGKEFGTRQNLKAHEKRHSAIRETVICPFCGKSMLRRTYEKHHSIYNCPGSATRLDGGLEHQKIKCFYCPSMLSDPQALRKHTKRFHTEEGNQRSHLCSACGKGFRSSVDLKTHMNTHEKARLWKCGWRCGKDFNVKRNWVRHESTCKYARVGGIPEAPEDDEHLRKPGRRRCHPVKTEMSDQNNTE